METARLYFQGAFIKEIAIPDSGYNRYIREASYSHPQTCHWVSEGNTPEDIMMDVYVMVFEQTGYETDDRGRMYLKYEYRYQEDRSSPVLDHPLDIGFELPPPNLSLDDFSKKMKQGVNLKGLLLRYYQT